MVTYIYILLNTINGKIYVGKTVNPTRRLQEHIKNSKQNKTSLIHRAILKYGVDAFQFTIIQNFHKEKDAKLAESYWIKYYKTCVIDYGSQFGYNLTRGGDGGSIFGELNPKAKLTNFQMEEIRISNLPTTILSKIYNVSRSTILRIRSGESWKHIKTNYSNPSDIKNIHQKYFNGENSHRSKLTWEIVRNIRYDFNHKNMIISELSKKYKTSWSNVKYIIMNNTWKE